MLAPNPIINYIRSGLPKEAMPQSEESISRPAANQRTPPWHTRRESHELSTRAGLTYVTEAGGAQRSAIVPTNTHY